MRRPALALASVLAAGVLLAGCTTPASRPDAGPGSGWKYYGIVGAGEGDDGGDAPASDLSDGVSFDEQLPAGVSVEWTDTMFADADFTVDSPDDGEGRWSYLQTSTGCRVSFWQTRAGGIGSPGDERARSDALLVAYLDFDPDDVAEYVFETSVAVASDGTSFEVRALVGDDEETDWMTVARVFDGPDAGLALDITCPAGTDAETALTALMPDFVAARVS